MMRAIVTGGAGMLGHRLCGFLRDAGAQVTVMDDFSRGQNRLPNVSYIPILQADAGDMANCMSAFRGADVVFNLAGTIGGTHSIANRQASQFWLNLRLQIVPALAAAVCKVPIFVQTSSISVYAKDYHDPCIEKNGQLGEPESSNAGYAWAKRFGERVCEWALLPETRWMIARPANMFGLRDYYDERAHVIPGLIESMEQGKDAHVFGGNQIREFIYADDVAKGMMILADSGASGEIYNIGTNGKTRVSIYVLATLIRELLNSSSKIVIVEGRPQGVEISRTNCAKICALGWQHQISLSEGLRRVIAERQTDG